MQPERIAHMIDHTLLKPEATEADIRTLCNEAKTHQFHSVCIHSHWIPTCASLLKGTAIDICSVIGFPLGMSHTACKVYETEWAVAQGATEIDMVINMGAFKSKDDDSVVTDIQSVKSACKNALLKVIIETALLNTNEIVHACELVKDSGADYVKTSTGFSAHGATPEHIALMRKTVGPDMGIKAAGGVRTLSDAMVMINSGATRIGASSSVDIISGHTATTDY